MRSMRAIALLALASLVSVGSPAQATKGSKAPPRAKPYTKTAADKFARVRPMLHGKMARIRADVAETLRTPKRDKETAIAIAIALMDSTTMRPGSDRYAKPHGERGQRTYGALSLLAEHFPKSRAVDFEGKASKRWYRVLRNRRLARALALFRKGAAPADTVLSYVTSSGHKTLSLTALRKELRARYGDVLPKDIRTLRANEALQRALMSAPLPRSLEEAESTLEAMIKKVAHKLNHEWTVCRDNYLDYQTLYDTPLAPYALSQRLIPAPLLLTSDD